MTKLCSDMVRDIVGRAAEELKVKLLPTPEHPDRNPYAHVWRAIKEAMGKSYRECDDADLDRIIEVVDEVVLAARRDYDEFVNRATKPAASELSGPVVP